jgi:hypothetical protein
MPGLTSALETEWSLLRAACSTGGSQEKRDRTRLLLRSPIRWKLLSDLAERHGVQPLLCQALSGVDLVPSEQMRILQQGYQSNLHKSLFLSSELIHILECLSASGIEVIPYKGLALAETVYGDIALRQSGDIDLLVRVLDVPRIKQAVRDLGYTPHSLLSPSQERAYLKSGYECAFDGTAGRNLLEVQWAIQPRFYAVDFDMDGLFRRAVTVSVAGRTMKTPSPEDSFIVLALHAAKHVWGRLIWLSDLARIITIPTLNWEWIGAQARKMGIVRVLRVTRILANRLLETPIPAQAEQNLPADAVAQLLAEEIESYLTSDSTYDVESFDYFKLMMQLRERRTDRLRFLSRLIFTPGAGEWAAVRLPEPLFPLYPIVRLARLAVRLVKT